jgi:hemolysin activation/secretion protein
LADEDEIAADMTRKYAKPASLALAIALSCASTSGWAQDRPDRVDPAVIAQDLVSPFRADEKEDDLRTSVEAPRSDVALDTEGGLFIGAVLVEGSGRIPADRFAAAIEPFVGRTLGADELRALASAVAGVARAQGYVLANAWIPRQKLESGVLRVQLDEGRIETVRVEGSRNGLVRALLAPLASGEALQRGELERRLMLAGDVPGIRLLGSRYLVEDGKSVLVVQVTETRSSFSLLVDNSGTEAIGPIRAHIAANVRGMALAGDETMLFAYTTPLDPSELWVLGARYAAPVDKAGTALALSGSVARSRPGGEFRASDTRSQSTTLTGSGKIPVLRRRSTGLWVELAASVSDVEQFQAGTRIGADRISTISAQLVGVRMLPYGYARADAALVGGVGLFNATREGDPLASRSDGDARFAKVEVSADWVNRLSGPLSIALAGAGQISSRPLLIGEELGIGGRRFGRAFDYYERSGDNGVAGSAELRLALESKGKSVTNAMLYTYADAAKVWDIGDVAQSAGTLCSAGFGFRGLLRNRLELGAELAIPLNTARFETGNRNPRVALVVQLRI